MYFPDRVRTHPTQLVCLPHWMLKLVLTIARYRIICFNLEICACGGRIIIRWLRLCASTVVCLLTT